MLYLDFGKLQLTRTSLVTIGRNLGEDRGVRPPPPNNSMGDYPPNIKKMSLQIDTIREIEKEN